MTLHFSLILGSSQQWYRSINFHVFFPWILPSVAEKICLQYHLPVEVWFQFSSMVGSGQLLAVHFSLTSMRERGTYPQVSGDN